MKSRTAECSALWDSTHVDGARTAVQPPSMNRDISVKPPEKGLRKINSAQWICARGRQPRHAAVARM